MAYDSDLVRTKNWGTEILTDADLEGQFDLIIAWVMAAMNSTTGHNHDGTSNHGPKLSPANLVIASQAQGDVLYASSATAWARLGAGTSGYFLKTQGAAANPIWADATFVPTVTNALSGSVIQTVKASNSTGVSISATYTADDNPPIYSEGNAIVSGSITPNHASNLIRITFSSWFGKSTTGFFYAFLTNGTGSTVAIKTASQTCTNGDQTQIYLQHYLAAGGTSAITFYILGAVNTGTATMLSTSAGSHLHGASSENLLILEEIKA